MTLKEALAEVARLRAIIERNRARFKEMKAKASSWRDRALRGQATEAIHGLAAPHDPTQAGPLGSDLQAASGRASHDERLLPDRVREVAAQNVGRDRGRPFVSIGLVGVIGVIGPVGVIGRLRPSAPRSRGDIASAL